MLLSMGSLEPAAGNDELDTFERLLALLDEHSADYRVLEHPPEGRTEAVSRLRGNDLGQAAKCIVLLVKIGKKVKRYVLAVVPGDRRVDFSAVKDLFGATYVGFADAPTAERLARSVAGTVLPFAFDPRLEVVVDPDLLAVSTVYFNAARLDRSLALKTVDFKRIAQPRVARLAGRPSVEFSGST